MLAAGVVARPGVAQVAVVGVVVDSTASLPLPGAEVRVLAKDGAVLARGTAGARGTFRLQVPASGLRLQAVFPGYRATTVPIPAVGPARLGLVRVHRLVDQVVTPQRGAGSTLNAPTAVTVLGAGALGREIALGGPARQLEAVPGVAVAEKGLMQASISARGPGSVNSAALLMLTDYRVASVPALRLNVPYLIPPIEEDLARVEVVRGPSSALYGPDADRGVVHFITRSPLDEPGGTASLTAGSRSVIQGGVRYAVRPGDRVGIKASGSYLTGDDWPITDPADSVPHSSVTRRYSTEMRADWAVTPRTTGVLGAGTAVAVQAVDLTEVGGVQLRDWQTSYAQLRAEGSRFLANAFVNVNDAGESYFLRTGLPVVDESSMWAAQTQARGEAGPVPLRVGLDAQRIIPRTGGTVHGRNEEDDDIWQAGVWAEGTLQAAARLEVFAAARADHHSRLDDFEVAPRVGLVWQPGEGHALRLTFNRASSTPVANDLFLDLSVSDALQPLGYDIRGAGSFHAWNFRRDCGGVDGLCMRSPFTPASMGGPAAYVPAEGTAYWETVQQAAAGALDGVPAPTPAQVPTVLAALDPATGEFALVDPDRVTDVPRARRSITTAFEAGWRGELGGRLTAAVDAYHSSISNVGSALSVQTPNAFLEGAALATYLVQAGYSEESAASIATQVARFPLGTVSPSGAPDPTAILLIPRQGGEADFWGLDLDLALDAGRGFTVAGRLSWVSEERFEGAAGISDVALNAPQTQGAIGLRWRRSHGLWASLSGRAESGFSAQSGVYRGQVPGYAVLDAGVGIAFSWLAGGTLTLSATNLFDHEYISMPGGPRIGRLVLARVAARY